MPAVAAPAPTNSSSERRTGPAPPRGRGALAEADEHAGHRGGAGVVMDLAVAAAPRLGVGASSVLRRLLTLAHEGEEERDDQAITDASGAALDLDERREVEYLEV